MAGGDLVNVNPQAINTTIEFLTAMVTPTLLITASGSLVLSTSTRLGRVVDRVRQLEVRLGELIYVDDPAQVPLYEKRVEVVVDLIDKVTTRSRLLQRALESLYYSIGVFILTSVTIAVVALLGVYRWLPIAEGVIGIVFMMYASLLLVRETRMATATINAEMDFTWELAHVVAPAEVIGKYARKGKFGGMATAKLRQKNDPRVSKTLGGE
jgi:Protein of unknown function (DUF2721)